MEHVNEQTSMRLSVVDKLWLLWPFGCKWEVVQDCHITFHTERVNPWHFDFLNLELKPSMWMCFNVEVEIWSVQKLLPNSKLCIRHTGIAIACCFNHLCSLPFFLLVSVQVQPFLYMWWNTLEVEVWARWRRDGQPINSSHYRDKAKQKASVHPQCVSWFENGVNTISLINK